MNAKQKVGKRIQIIRTGKGLSQREFAMTIGMDRTYLSGIEAGRRNGTITSLERIANGLGVTLAELFVDFE